jgi:hypothetical protein
MSAQKCMHLWMLAGGCLAYRAWISGVYGWELLTPTCLLINSGARYKGVPTRDMAMSSSLSRIRETPKSPSFTLLSCPRNTLTWQETEALINTLTWQETEALINKLTWQKTRHYADHAPKPNTHYSTHTSTCDHLIKNIASWQSRNHPAASHNLTRVDAQTRVVAHHFRTLSTTHHLQVSVHDSLLVQVLQSGYQFSDDAPHLRFRHHLPLTLVPIQSLRNPHAIKFSTLFFQLPSHHRPPHLQILFGIRTTRGSIK